MEKITFQNTPCDNKTVSYLPFSISANGPAKVKEYFQEYEKNGNLKASFRGRPLIGSHVLLPDGYKGYIVEKSNDGKNGRITGKFDDLKYWNLDKIPSKDDAFLSAFDWLDISRAIHEKVENEKR